MAIQKVEADHRVDEAISSCGEYLADQQGREGLFDLGFDGGPMPDAHLLTMAELLGLDGVTPEQRRLLARKLLDRQLPEGAWALAPGLEPELAVTVDAYVALRLSGMAAEELCLKRARAFVRAAGGLSSVRGPTAVTLALLGLIPWQEVAVPPPELALLPPDAPVSLFRVGALLRLHVLPLLVLRAEEAIVAPASVGAQLRRELRGLIPDGPSGAPRVSSSEGRGIKRGLRQEALAACVRLMEERVDEDGTLGGLLLATVWAAAAARVLGLGSGHALVEGPRRGVAALLQYGDRREIHALVCRPAVRSTAHALAAIRGSSMDADSSASVVITKAVEALKGCRAEPSGDFEQLGPRGPATAWSIKPKSRRYPTVQDTAQVILAIEGLPGAEQLVTGAARWVYAMQRPDGGFPLFDRDAASAPWLRKLPFGLLAHTLNDMSSPEVTGIVLELAVRRGGLGQGAIDRACVFLERSQRGDGAWESPFSCGVLNATSAAVCGLAAAGRGASRAARRGVDLLLSNQRKDGGWGESPESSVVNDYIDLGRSIPSHTGAALRALVASDSPVAARGAVRAVEYLLWSQEPDGSWVEDDPAAAGLARIVYLRDPIDRLASPMLALEAYRRQLQSSATYNPVRHRTVGAKSHGAELRGDL